MILGRCKIIGKLIHVREFLMSWNDATSYSYDRKMNETPVKGKTPKDLTSELCSVPFLSDTRNECGKNTKAMKFSRQLPPIQIMIDQKQPENVEYFNYLCSMITDDASCTLEIKCRIAMAQADFNKNTSHQQTGLTFMEET